ncbi:MAG: M24 family metallopeptidase [Terriglobales bacterium]
MKIADFSAEELARFKAFQRASYETLVQVAQTLAAGESERQVARRVRKRFHEQGVHHYFHVPVVLFGARTAYPGAFGAFEALSTDQVLQPGMPVILDAAPIYAGYTVDTSYAFSFGDNATQRELAQALKPLRELILRRTRERASFRDVSLEVDREIKALGYENCHRKHLGAVLGHRLTRVPDRWLNRRRVWGLGAVQVGWFLGKSLASQWWGGDGSPNWNHLRTSDHPPTAGLWAIEPHLGCRGVGAKFEEILVVTRDDAFWLDDGGLPHHRN